MTARLTLLGLLAALGCSASTLPMPIDDPPFVDGPLTLAVSDAPAMAGVLWVAPTAEGAPGAVTARAVRYGSRCATAVTGHAEIAGNRVVLHVAYTPRLTICTADLRALSYLATIVGLAPGRYEVHILHSEGNGTAETEVRVQSVDVS